MSLYARLSAAMSRPHLSPRAALVGADIAGRLKDFDPQYREAIVSWYEAAVVPGADPGPCPEPPPPPPIDPELPVAFHWRCITARGFVQLIADEAEARGRDELWQMAKLRKEEARILPGHDQPHLRRMVARYPAVVELTRAARVLAAKLDGDEHRGMIPGGEDEAAYLAAIARGETDPDPVWSDAPVFVGESW